MMKKYTVADTPNYIAERIISKTHKLPFGKAVFLFLLRRRI